jgi:hypothetical protein
LSSPSRKNISLLRPVETLLNLTPSRPHKRGASRSSRTLGAGCGGRGGVTRRMTRPRTAKPCGPDAPTLASSLRNGDVSPNRLTRRAGDGGKRARSPGRARSRPLKPLRRECRVTPGEPVATTRVLSTFAHEATGAAGIRHSLRPLILRDTVRA